MTVKVKVWDLPLRLFHWSLVLAVTAAIVTGEIGGAWADWHGRAGLLVLGLLVFRLIWGFVGSTHARFASFFPTPSKVLGYLRGAWQGVGHNPLGALSVLALLTILALQVGTGLFANDDITFEGPLFHLIDKDLSDKLTGWHARIFWGLVSLLGLHIASIVFYARVKKHNLVGPMLTGHKEVPKALATPSEGHGLGRFVTASALSGVLVWTVANGLPERLINSINANAASVDAEEAEEPESAAF
ncbi:cytochrome b/b6 domain-containing protein [Methylococcus sp. EFPC2]|uniref:cytochrome b/b6 domain-containing protein n=1 Tax=Methylococcus sp. EFPC2 TaxID=2812648 RepID=UPI0019678D42|nr:cytochrome b/b6 domain-containing protein [Methylococcus sp. EFPC2]QSA96420.1 cytochrome b/b6 domain-containing protein [Methylococcus sp. EFPC2]